MQGARAGDGPAIDDEERGIYLGEEGGHAGVHDARAGKAEVDHVAVRRQQTADLIREDLPRAGGAATLSN